MKNNRFYSHRPHLNRMSDEVQYSKVDWARLGLAVTIAFGFGIGLTAEPVINAVSSISF